MERSVTKCSSGSCYTRPLSLPRIQTVPSAFPTGQGWY